MFQLKTLGNGDFFPTLVSDPVYLRTPEPDDYSSWAALRNLSREHLTAWEDDWGPDDLGAAAYRKRLRLFEKEARRGAALSMLVFLREDRMLLGGLTLTNIRYGAARAGTLGYWIGKPHIGKGYGAAAVSIFAAHAIETIGLNRIEAACQPENAASRALLLKCGFEQEGLARDYLKINGEWRDHALFALTARRRSAFLRDAK